MRAYALFHKRVVEFHVRYDGGLNPLGTFRVASMCDGSLRATKKLRKPCMMMRIQDGAHLGERIQRSLGMGPERLVRLLERRHNGVLLCPGDQNVVGGNADLNHQSNQYISQA